MVAAPRASYPERGVPAATDGSPAGNALAWPS